MDLIDTFLENLCKDESLFPMDNYEDEPEKEKILTQEQNNSEYKKRIMIDLDGTMVR